MSPAVLSVPFNVTCASQATKGPQAGSGQASHPSSAWPQRSRPARDGASGGGNAAAAHGAGASGRSGPLSPVLSRSVPSVPLSRSVPSAPFCPAAPGPAQPGLVPVPTSRERTRDGVTRRGGRPRARAPSRYLSRRRRILPRAPPPPSGEFCTAAGTTNSPRGSPPSPPSPAPPPPAAPVLASPFPPLPATAASLPREPERCPEAAAAAAGRSDPLRDDAEAAHKAAAAEGTEELRQR